MDLSARRQPPTVRLRRLASELRALRIAAGLTQEEMSELTAINSATLYRIENAKVRPQRRTLMTMLDRYNVTDEAQRAALIDLSKQATQLGWLQAYESELPEEYSAYISFEAEARSVRNFESSFIPGLLQTEDYARAVIRGVMPEFGDNTVEGRVAARMKRKESIAKTDPLKLWAIIDEAILHREVGSQQIMIDQLNHMAAMASEPHLTLQVLPYGVGAHPGMHGAFAIMEFPDATDADLVYVENLASDRFLEREADLRRYSAVFEHLRAAALSPKESIRLVTDLARTE